MDNRNALAPGTMLRQYRIDQLIGQGGFGITYLAFDTDLQRKVAIKECFPRDFVDRDGTTIVPTGTKEKVDFDWALGKFVDEATTLARFRHPGIVQVLQIIKDTNNSAYMVLEFVDGQSLDEWLKTKESPLTEQELKALIGPMIDALQVVHNNGIVHRDIAPDNIFIRQSGEAVLLDFGAAKQTVGNYSRTMNLVVKDGYSAPEQYYTEGRQGPWTDVYAFAAVLYRCITGKRPIDAMARLDAINNDEPDPIIALRSEADSTFSDAFINAINLGLSPQVKARPQSLSEWRPKLIGARNRAKPASKNSVAAAKTPSSKAQPSKKRESKRSAVMAIAAALAITATAGAVYLTQQSTVKRDENAWATAQQMDTLEAYRAFINDYPTSSLLNQANAAMRAFTQPWQSTAGTIAAERANSVTATAERIYVAGTIALEDASGVDAVIKSFSLSGREKWSATVGGEGNQTINDILVLDTGSIIGVGSVTSATNATERAIISSFSPSGDVEWTREVGGVGSALYAISQADDGRLLAAGYTQSAENDSDDGWLVELSSNGSIIDQRRYGGGSEERFLGIETIAGGAIALVGQRSGNFWILKQTAQHAVLKELTPGGPKNDVLDAVTSSPSGDLIAVGQTESFGTDSVDSIIFYLDSLNQPKQPKMIADQDDDYLTSVKFANDGSILVGGYTSSRGAGQTDGWILSYNSSLSRVNWERVIGKEGWETLNDIAVLADGSLVAVGSTDSAGAGNSDFWIIRLSADGRYASD